MRVITVNCNGIRKKYKRLILEKLLFDLNIGICVLTETHLRKQELDQVKFTSYIVVSESCRVARNKIGGGVLIMVHPKISAVKHVK